MILTKRIKIKPNCYPWLNKAAEEINFVWNYCRYIATKAIQDRNKCLSPFDLINLTSGSSKEFERIGAANICTIANEYGIRRNQFKKLKLKYRSKKSLGWIPFKPEQIIKIKGNGFTFCKKRIRLFENLPEGKLKEGNFAQDSLGDWYFCVPYQVEEKSIPYKLEVCGIDIGLKTTAITSSGEKLISDFYKKSEEKLANLQRRGHRKQAKFLHRKIKNQRNNAIHNFSREIVNKHQNIYIGNVNFEFLSTGNKTKSAYDGSMEKLKTQLKYKGQQANRWVQVIEEKYTTQDCSNCGARSGPKGLKQLVVREWQCTECGAVHDRDINAAINIAILGMEHHPPLAGTSQINCNLSEMSAR